MDKYNQKAQNVILMSEYQRETGYAALAQVEGYWQALRGSRLLPKRSEIDPRGIELALENTFILERIAPSIARLRIAGSHLNDLMGMEVRGMPLTALFTPPSRRIISDLLEEVFQGPGVVTARLQSEGGWNKPALEARMLLLPLRSDLGDVSRVLGCFVARGEMGQAPRRFEIVASKVEPLQLPGIPSGGTSPTPPIGSHQEVSPPIGFADPQTPFGGHATAKGEQAAQRRPSYLRVVKDEEES